MKSCSRCHAYPRIPGQRWCKQCFTAYRRHARAKTKASPVHVPPMPAEPPTVRFWSKYLGFSLKVRGMGLVRFQDGLLETANPVIIEAIRKNDFYTGIITEGTPPPAPPKAASIPPKPRVYPPMIPKWVLGDW